MKKRTSLIVIHLCIDWRSVYVVVLVQSLVWIAVKKMSHANERLCDLRAIEKSRDRYQYARILLENSIVESVETEVPSRYGEKWMRVAADTVHRFK